MFCICFYKDITDISKIFKTLYYIITTDAINRENSINSLICWKIGDKTSITRFRLDLDICVKQYV